MRGLVAVGRALLEDLASTLLFLAVYALSRNVVLSVCLGIALAGAQIGWRLLYRQRVDALQWVSLAVIIMSGSATLLTHNPVFVMLKPTAIYILVGSAMLQRGWMLRYLPPRAMELVPDLAIGFGYVWAGLMFFSAALNLVLATHTSLLVWGSMMSVWGIASKAALSFLQYGVMRFIGKRRYLARTGGAPPIHTAQLGSA
jgi:intracellular septation protein A